MLEEQLTELIRTQRGIYRELRQLRQHLMNEQEPKQLNLPGIEEPEESHPPAPQAQRWPIAAVSVPEGAPRKWVDLDYFASKTELPKSTISSWKSKGRLPAEEFKRFGRFMRISGRAAIRLYDIASACPKRYQNKSIFVGQHLKTYGLWGGDVDTDTG